jgi:hypothetical protein
MKFSNLLNSTKYQDILIAAGFIVSILYVVFLVFFGMDFTDSFFHINNIEIKETKHSTFLTYVFMDLWQNLFGNKLISFRLLNAFLTLSSVFIPLFIFRKQLKTQVYIVAFFSVLLLASVFNNVCGYDAFSRVFLVLVFSFFIRYIQTDKAVFILLLTLFSAVLIGVRMPNIVVIPILAFLFIVHESILLFTKRKTLRQALSKLAKIFSFFLVIFSVPVVLLSVFYEGLILNFYNGFLAAVKTFLSADSQSSYSGISIFNNYIRDFHKLIQYTGVLFLFLFLSKIKPRDKKINTVYDFLLVLFFAFYAFVGVIYTDKNFYFYSFYTSLMFFTLLIAAKKELDNRNYDKIFIFISIVMFSLVNPFGSNTGLLKVFPFLTMIFPVFFIFYEFKINKKILAFAFVVILFSFYTRLNHTYEDAKLYRLVLNSSYSEIPKIKQIGTSSDRITFLDNVYAD